MARVASEITNTLLQFFALVLFIHILHFYIFFVLFYAISFLHTYTIYVTTIFKKDIIEFT